MNTAATRPRMRERVTDASRAPAWLNASVPILLFASIAAIVGLTPTERSVAIPGLVMIDVAVIFIVMLWKRSSVFPFFELGTICVASTAIYSIFPLFGYFMSGLRWAPFSDNRLFGHDPSPEEIGAFAWRYVLYLVCLAGAYLLVRGRGTAKGIDMKPPDRMTIIIMAGLYLLVTGFFVVIERYYQVSYSPSYEEVREGSSLVTGLPYKLQQISHNLDGVSFVMKLCFVVLLLEHWKQRVWRWTLIGWLSVSLLLMIRVGGSRTGFVLTLMAAALLYHRLVRPMKLRYIAVGGTCILAGILVVGIVRDFEGGLRGIESDSSRWVVANEFQTLFGTAFDLYKRQEVGTLDVPWQVRWSEALMLIPGQLLPFGKQNPAQWYLDVLGRHETGLMFGVIAQCVTGFDWAEIVARGVFLGALCALVHRWYVRRSSSFWATVFYVFVCVWSYYTFRATTLYPVYFVVYSFVPAMLTVKSVRWLLGSR